MSWANEDFSLQQPAPPTGRILVLHGSGEVMNSIITKLTTRTIRVIIIIIIINRYGHGSHATGGGAMSGHAHTDKDLPTSSTTAQRQGHSRSSESMFDNFILSSLYLLHAVL